jgi:predicted nucleic acid-binding protein
LAHASADLTVKLLLVDTNIVSYFHRGDTRAKRYEPHLMGKQQPISFPDSWIAATALRHGMPLVTHNAQHFEGIPDLTIIAEPDPPATHSAKP